jgi:hypothetical protein
LLEELRLNHYECFIRWNSTNAIRLSLWQRVDNYSIGIGQFNNISVSDGDFDIICPFLNVGEHQVIINIYSEDHALALAPFNITVPSSLLLSSTNTLDKLAYWVTGNYALNIRIKRIDAVKVKIASF